MNKAKDTSGSISKQRLNSIIFIFVLIFVRYGRFSDNLLYTLNLSMAIIS